jgi:hypothetical protein
MSEQNLQLVEQIKGVNDSILVSYYEGTRAKRLALDKESEKLKEVEEIYKAELIHRMVHEKQGVLASQSHMVRLNTKEVPVARDWTAIREYIQKNQAWELMQLRLSSTAFAERWEAGEVVPGVEKFTTYNVSVSKLP